MVDHFLPRLLRVIHRRGAETRRKKYRAFKSLRLRASAVRRIPRRLLARHPEGILAGTHFEDYPLAFELPRRDPRCSLHKVSLLPNDTLAFAHGDLCHLILLGNGYGGRGVDGYF